MTVQDRIRLKRAEHKSAERRVCANIVPMRIRTIADSIARWALILLAGLTPLFILTASWATAAQAKILLASVVLLIALIAWLVARLLEGSVSIPRSIILLVTPLLPLAYVVSAL